jgi:hypothetical protein
VDTEDLLPSTGEQVLFLTLAIVAASCSKSVNPSAPEPIQMYMGTWTGAVTSDVIGIGSGTVTFDSGIKTSSGPILFGQWSFTFADARFNASGTVTAGSVPDTGAFVLLFSEALVPCPAEPGGVGEHSRAASLTFTPNRMYGSYIAAACPGGTMDLMRK